MAAPEPHRRLHRPAGGGHPLLHVSSGIPSPSAGPRSDADRGPARGFSTGRLLGALHGSAPQAGMIAAAYPPLGRLGVVRPAECCETQYRTGVTSRTLAGAGVG